MLVMSNLSFLMHKILKDFYAFKEFIDIKFNYINIILKLTIVKLNINL